MTPAARIEGSRVVLVRVAHQHVEALRKIHIDPAVRRWWHDPEPDWPLGHDDESVGYAVLLGGAVIGYVEYSEETDPMYRHAGIDVFLAPAVSGRGLGREVVAVLAAHLIDVRGHHRLVIDPAADNGRAIAAYMAVGFRPVGLMRRYERGLDGSWHDGLLMDLLASELVRAS